MGDKLRELWQIEKLLWLLTFVLLIASMAITTILPETRIETFGVCFLDHPNYDEKLCPHDELERWRLVQEDNAHFKQKWSDLDCKCPKAKENETSIEKWERVYCNRSCFEDGPELFGEIEDSFEYCKLSNPEYTKEKCAEGLEKYSDIKICNSKIPKKCEHDPLLIWRKEQEKQAQEMINNIKAKAEHSECGCSLNAYDDMMSPLNTLRLYKDCQFSCDNSERLILFKSD